MLLVDEFQDTDPLQYEIVLFLAEREEDDATDAYAADLRPGALFVVGTPNSRSTVSAARTTTLPARRERVAARAVGAPAANR